jgi:hypothetical protein
MGDENSDGDRTSGGSNVNVLVAGINDFLSIHPLMLQMSLAVRQDQQFERTHIRSLVVIVTVSELCPCSQWVVVELIGPNFTN